MAATGLKIVGRGATKGGKKVVLKRNGYGKIVQLISFIGNKLVRGRSENGQRFFYILHNILTSF